MWIWSHHPLLSKHQSFPITVRTKPKSSPGSINPCMVWPHLVLWPHPSHSLPSLQPQGLSLIPSKVPWTLLPQGLCTDSCPSLDCSHDPITPILTRIPLFHQILVPESIQQKTFSLPRSLHQTSWFPFFSLEYLFSLKIILLRTYCIAQRTLLNTL